MKAKQLPVVNTILRAVTTVSNGQRVRAWRLFQAEGCARFCKTIIFRVSFALVLVLLSSAIAEAGRGTPALRVDTDSPSLNPAAPIVKRTRARRMDVEDKRSKVDTFLAVTGTEDATAAEAMLEGNGWNVEGAIDFFFATDTAASSGIVPNETLHRLKQNDATLTSLDLRSE